MFVALVGVVVSLGACGDSSANPPGPPDARGPDAPVVEVDASPQAPDASCFMNPTTHAEIINACTTADKVDKDDSNLPLLNDDGSLPPLPP